MGENKGQTIFLSVIGIATLLVAIIGATFAYFTTTMTNGGETGSSIKTAELKGVTFTTSGGETLTDVFPGASFSDTTVLVETESIPANTEIPYTCTVSLTSTKGTGENAAPLANTDIQWSATSTGGDTAVNTTTLDAANTFSGKLTNANSNVSDTWTVKAKFINKPDAEQNTLQGATATIKVTCKLVESGIKYSAE